jgi:N-acetylglutamate synthase
VHAFDALRIEEAGFNALQTQRQLFYDGWLLRVSPGKAKRARSVNAHFGSSLPLDAKIAHCEAIYAHCGLPALFRITPFRKPSDLDAALERRGYVAFDPTRVQALSLREYRNGASAVDVEILAATAAEFVEAVGAFRASPSIERAAHLERLSQTPLTMHAVIARFEGEAVACGQVALDRGIAGIYDMVTASAHRGKGLATAIVDALLRWTHASGASCVFLQVNDDNAPALAVYRRFGFSTVYRYHYRARPGECR